MSAALTFDVCAKKAVAAMRSAISECLTPEVVGKLWAQWDSFQQAAALNAMHAELVTACGGEMMAERQVAMLAPNLTEDAAGMFGSFDYFRDRELERNEKIASMVSTGKVPAPFVGNAAAEIAKGINDAFDDVSSIDEAMTPEKRAAAMKWFTGVSPLVDAIRVKKAEVAGMPNPLAKSLKFYKPELHDGLGIVSIHYKNDVKVETGEDGLRRSVVHRSPTRIFATAERKKFAIDYSGHDRPRVMVGNVVVGYSIEHTERGGFVDIELVEPFVFAKGVELAPPVVLIDDGKFQVKALDVKALDTALAALLRSGPRGTPTVTDIKRVVCPECQGTGHYTSPLTGKRSECRSCE